MWKRFVTAKQKIERNISMTIGKKKKNVNLINTVRTDVHLIQLYFPLDVNFIAARHMDTTYMRRIYK